MVAQREERRRRRANQAAAAAKAANGAFDAAATADQLTVAFWSFGAAELPVNNSVFYGTQNSDGSGKRVLNVHLPWSDGNIYWDTGTGETTENQLPSPMAIPNPADARPMAGTANSSEPARNASPPRARRNRGRAITKRARFLPRSSGRGSSPVATLTQWAAPSKPRPRWRWSRR